MHCPCTDKEVINEMTFMAPMSLPGHDVPIHVCPSSKGCPWFVATDAFVLNVHMLQFHRDQPDLLKAMGLEKDSAAHEYTLSKEGMARVPAAVKTACLLSKAMN